MINLGTLIQGYPIMGNTITINKLIVSNSSFNILPIILGISIPLLALGNLTFLFRIIYYNFCHL